MSFDKKKDKVLATFEAPSGLQMSVCSYDGGPSKIQIGPREVGKSEDGTPIYRKAGRLTFKEYHWLCMKWKDALLVSGGIGDKVES